MGRTDSLATDYEPLPIEFDPLTDDFVPKTKRYIHFDLPLSDDELAKIDASPSAILAHEFWPLLGFIIQERRVKPKLLKDGTPCVENGKTIVEFKPKDRRIKFASHKDAAMLQKYSKRLASRYEHLLHEIGLDQNILAYRSGIGSNIQMAKSLFDEIREKKDVTFLAFDISGFFDNIQHSTLKKSIARLFPNTVIPDPDYKVFRNITRYSYVESGESLQLRLGRKKPINGRICTATEFREKIRGQKPSLVKTNISTIGIPQGTAVSGLYANISLLAFDESLKNRIEQVGGSYRRYSDDIALVLPSSQEAAEVEKLVQSEIAKVGLEINAKKTEKAIFSESSGKLLCNGRCQYLGFTFDGRKILIRESSLTRYYKKMRKGIHAKMIAAKMKNLDAKGPTINPTKIYRRKLLKTYTHFGYSRNFPRYAYRASELLEAPEIRQQISRHMSIFRKTWKREMQRVFGTNP